MNFKRTMRFSGVAVCICSASLADNADAQSAGSITTSVGWLHIAPQGDATPLIVQSVGGVTVNRQLAGTGAHASSTDTLGITTEYYVTDNLGVAMLLGMPLKVNLIGDGTLQKYGTLGTTRPMPPAIELRYHFFSAAATFRPYLGIGANYTWFTQVRATNSQFVSDSFGPGGSARATLSASWNPVFEIGANYAVTRHWSVGTSVGYMPVKTHLTLYGQTATGTQIVSKSTLRLNPLSVFLNVAYTF
ncbi:MULTISPECIES: OmpW family outer membrane protein [unclassified Burkholderia]|uniref:OmpW/AlkL family protein n=1 Tax=unclassified Burkholderia TaxID=2613784 RepID=UPI00141EC896|nr:MULTISPECIES: OmpW family outer membrane protein [unclassified Burkholderia]NIE55516.1 OmpW family protein [Burkholderia sp. Ap-955]NIF08736.1 OmpW family protein [Burkholderia sp. Ax-1735]NIG02316.1 OmpW family protein [Burkholderia sp. Tr-849]